MAVRTGNNGDNTLNGTSSADTLYGRAGDDTLHGRAGDDKLYGEDGADQLNGEAGTDRMWGAQRLKLCAAGGTGRERRAMSSYEQAAGRAVLARALALGVALVLGGCSPEARETTKRIAQETVTETGIDWALVCATTAALGNANCSSTNSLELFGWIK